MIKFVTNYNYEESVGEITNTPSMTEPCMALTIKDIFKRAAVGDTDVIEPTDGDYHDEEFGTQILDNMDKFEALDLVRNIAQEKYANYENEINELKLAEKEKQEQLLHLQEIEKKYEELQQQQQQQQQ